MSEEKLVYNFSSDPSGTHMLIADKVNSGSKVLDIGCASGYLGEFLIKKKNCEVWGIEPDMSSYRIAMVKGYKNIINKNVEAGLEDDLIINEKFDFIILGDVLEHLIDPGIVLRKLKNYLRENGRLVVSLPNIAHYSTRFSLLFGRWNMKDSGILDKTHLHFYTLKTVKKLLDDNGWNVESMRPRGDLERCFRQLGLEMIGQKLLFLWPQLFAIQFVFSVKKKI